MFLKQSTAVDVMLGPFVDDTDGKTTEEALTLSQADLQLTKNGGAAAQKNDATSATHIYGGNYKVPLNTMDTNTLGQLTVMCKESGALPVIRHFIVIPANVYDSLVGGSDNLQVDTIQVGGTTQTARDLGASVLVSAGTGTGQLDLTSGRIKADAVYWNAAAIATPDTAGYPKVTIKDGTGQGEIALSAGAVDAVNDVFNVQAIASGAITASSIATGAIDADALAADAVDEILDEVVEGAITLRQAIRLFLSTLTAKSSGGGTASITFRDIGDTKDRIIMTVDSSGNRTAVGTRDGS